MFCSVNGCDCQLIIKENYDDDDDDNLDNGEDHQLFQESPGLVAVAVRRREILRQEVCRLHFKSSLHIQIWTTLDQICR